MTRRIAGITGKESLKDAFRDQGGKIRVLLVDDHPVIRQAISTLLAAEHDIEVVDQAASCGEMVVTLVQRYRPHIVIMDVRMEGIGGIEATRRIKKEHPKTRVLALSMIEDPAIIQAMLKAGADDFLHKSATTDDLLTAIRKHGTPALAA